jgi:hypothetical protein
MLAWSLLEYPGGIRERVLFLWLKAKSRDEIAKIMGIGAGSVSEIMKAYRANDTDIDLEREYVKSVKRQGYSIDQLEPVIRLKNRLEILNWKEEQVETLLDKIEEHRFKEEKDADVFIEEFEGFLENRPVFRKLRRAQKALAQVTKERYDATEKLSQVNDRLDDFDLIPKKRK